MKPILYVGNRNYSSWSMRGWLALTWGGVDFETRDVDLDAEGYGQSRIASVLAVSPSGRVPALEVDGVTVWDSLAIAEWAAERAPAAGLWPDDPLERAVARALTCEMHAGFSAIRAELPCNLRRRSATPTLPQAARDEIGRVETVFASQAERAKGRGRFMYGRRGIVDAFYLPLASRMRTYAIPLSDPAAAYRDALLDDADFRRWEASAETAWRPMRHGDAETRHA